MFETSPPPGVTVIRVAELNATVDLLLRENVPPVWVEGEISNWKPYPSGHIYFGLKDGENARIDAVMWRGNALRLPAGTRFGDGQQVIAFGTLSLYAQRGQYRIEVQRLFPKGLGAAEEALRQLRKKLLEKGYFAPERKRPLPRFPRRIALVTSGRGAAVRDMLEVLLRRWPAYDVVVYSVRVQGDGAAEEIAAALERLNALHSNGSLPVDVIVIGRGGGGSEDLWAFNAECVAEAIVRSAVPVVSAVGHEIDVTISDQVADLRATTPTNAAEECTRHWAEIEATLATRRKQLGDALERRIDRARRRLDELASRRAMRQPFDRLRDREQRLDELGQRLRGSAGRFMNGLRQRIGATAGRLEALSPLQVLGRGYSLTTTEGGRLVRDAAEVGRGETIITRLGRGRLRSHVLGEEGGDE